MGIWRSNYPNDAIKAIPAISSDHCPLILYAKPKVWTAREANRLAYVVAKAALNGNLLVVWVVRWPMLLAFLEIELMCFFVILVGRVNV